MDKRWNNRVAHPSHAQKEEDKAEDEVHKNGSNKEHPCEKDNEDDHNEDNNDNKECYDNVADARNKGERTAREGTREWKGRMWLEARIMRSRPTRTKAICDSQTPPSAEAFRWL